MSVESEDLDAPISKAAKRAKASIDAHLRFARKKVGAIRDERHNIKRGTLKPKQNITKENALEKREVLVEISKIADNKQTIVTSDIKKEIETFYPGIIETKKVGWEPFPGPQTDFLAADEFEVLFSGGRAPGKSDALLIDPLRHCDKAFFRGLIIRKAMQDLRDLIKRAKELYPLAYPGTRWKDQEKLFIFPSGATIEMGYCDHEDDVARYHGQEYSWLGIDELTQIPKEETYERLIACVRKPGIRNHVRCTTNPNGPGKQWVKKRFIDKGSMGKSILLRTHIEKLNKTIITTRKWIHGTVFDNPKVVAENPEYIAMLQNIDNEVLRKQWLEGDWDSADGLAFDEFERKVHVIEPFKIPEAWFKFRACDWGFKTKAVCLWFAVDYDGRLYVYRELVTGGQTPAGKVLAKDFGLMVRGIEMEAMEKIRYGILDASAWSQRGENAPPPAEDMAGLNWRPSDRTKHSRITGKQQLHSYLQKEPDTGKPKIFFFNTCIDTIASISSIGIDKNDPEDVDSKGDDHAYDACRYGVMSRPRTNNNYSFASQQAQPPTILDPTFGY